MARGRLVNGLIAQTKTEANNMAIGYRSGSYGGKAKVRGSVVIAEVGRYWGVFDLRPQDNPRTKFISLTEGKTQGYSMYHKPW